ncbi:LysR family transcriptional regulator [Kitasatospora sp. NBC_01539]|uniref:LysR family transcriptional regulator n=1 Tax=Kitasatospora sp. NBC_01539 TaxID=2903577 RepID=UPI003860120D
MPPDLHPRLLRGFVAVAETLHFGRAAAGLYVAQQALSRDVQALERQLGELLFHRTSRSVRLTPAGESLLPRARRLLALHDEILTSVHRRVLLVDLNSDVEGDDLTPARVLDAARTAAPDTELLARFHGGLAAAAEELAAHRLDVAFGRFAGLPARTRERLVHVPVRLEPLAVVVPDGHPLAAPGPLPVAALAGHPLDVLAGNPATTEWTDLGLRLVRDHGLSATPGRTPPVGVPEFARYLGRHRVPVLTTTGGPRIPGAVTRPLVDPLPLALLGLVHRPGLRHPGLAALRAAAARLGRREGWLVRPPGSWLPAEDAALVPAGRASAGGR